jgi:hypothetical protein
MESDDLFLSCLRANASGGRTSYAAIGATLAESGGSKSVFADMFRTVQGRLLLGQDVRSAFESGIRRLRLSDRALEARLIEVSNCWDAKEAALRVCDVMEAARRSRLELGYGALQKYLTVALLSSVILPSLALFGFVGYSMLYSSSVAFVAFSAILVAVFPVLFAFIQKRIADLHG